MDAYLWWLLVAIALVIAELASGTLYLLVLAGAAFAGAALAYFGQSFWLSAIIASAVAVCGVIVVGRYRGPRAVRGSASLDVGQSCVFESWVSENDRLARVRYRNTVWDARVLESNALESGRVLHIRAVEGNTLQVSVTAD